MQKNLVTCYVRSISIPKSDGGMIHEHTTGNGIKLSTISYCIDDDRKR